MSLDLSVCSFDSFMSSGLLRGPNNFYVYMNHSSTQDEAMLLLWFVLIVNVRPLSVCL